MNICYTGRRKEGLPVPQLESCVAVLTACTTKVNDLTCPKLPCAWPALNADRASSHLPAKYHMDISCNKLAQMVHF